MKEKLGYTLLTLVGAAIWGCAFTFQSMAAGNIGPLFFNALRSLLGALAISPLLFLNKPKEKSDFKGLVLAGSLSGLFLFLGSYFQQSSLVDTGTAKASFITALYVIMVPLIHLLAGRKTASRLWLSVLLALAGLYILCGLTSLKLTPSDIRLFACALAFALQIIVIDSQGGRHDGIRLSLVQFIVCTILSLIGALLSEQIRLSAISDCMIPLLYTGILSSGAGYTIQIIGQKHLDPTLASLCMSMESVFGALGGWLILNQKLNCMEIVGCLLMSMAIIIAQLPEKRPK